MPGAYIAPLISNRLLRANLGSLNYAAVLVDDILVKHLLYHLNRLVGANVVRLASEVPDPDRLVLQPESRRTWLRGGLNRSIGICPHINWPQAECSHLSVARLGGGWC